MSCSGSDREPWTEPISTALPQAIREPEYNIYAFTSTQRVSIGYNCSELSALRNPKQYKHTFFSTQRVAIQY